MNHQTERIVIRGEQRILIIPDGVTKIEAYAYAGREDFTHVSIPNSVTEIGDCAFVNCKNLVELSLPDGLSNLGKYVFLKCTALRNVILPYTLTEIPDGFFQDCENLSAVDFCGGSMVGRPSGLQKIGRHAFARCKEYDCPLPNGVEEIGDFAFVGCYSLGKGAIPPALPGMISLPGALTKLGSYAFMECTGIEMISTGGLEVIPMGAFAGCTRLCSCISRGLTEIGDFAFADCESLHSLSLPKTVEKIGRGAYKGCALLDASAFPDRFAEQMDSILGRCASDEA
ncbi:MAG: leucine-rich repeat domain-containing protein [Clostridia bacterium]|nr:leucine-rich repeat domain-containing protein [Clostridia bacterium]